MFRFLTVLAAMLLLCTQAALAQQGSFSFADEPAQAFEHIEIDGHQVFFPSSSYGGFRFADSVTFFCRQYGDVGDLIGAVVVFGPQSDNTRRIEDIPDSAVVYSTSLFDIKDTSETGGWFTVPIELLKLPEGGFSIVVYTHSNAERGLELGLAPSLTNSTQSYTARVLTKEQLEDDPAAGLLRRSDNMEWLLRANVMMESGLGSGISSADISGSSFGYYDDGSVDTWEDFRTNGGVLRFDNNRKRDVDAIYIYGKLAADWFGTDRDCSVTIMDDRLNIIKRMSIPYLAFNESGSWARLEVPNREVSKTFYVIVQPHSEKEVQFLLGVDTSGNKASSVGSTGAHLEWLADSPEADTNWMVRVHYSD